MDSSLLKISIQISGLFAVMAGILNIYLSFQNQAPDNGLPWYFRAADISVLITLIGIYLARRQQIGAPGLIAMLIIAAALLLLIFNLYYPIAIAIYTAGLIFLAIIFLYTRTFPYWIACLWILAPVLALPGYVFNLSPGTQTFFVRLGTIAFGLGFMGLGYQLFSITKF